MKSTPPYPTFLNFCRAHNIPALTHREWLWAGKPTPQQYTSQAHSAPGLPFDHTWGHSTGDSQ